MEPNTEFIPTSNMRLVFSRRGVMSYEVRGEVSIWPAEKKNRPLQIEIVVHCAGAADAMNAATACLREERPFLVIAGGISTQCAPPLAVLYNPVTSTFTVKSTVVA